MMLKWDIWSFGCICLELLAYSSPVFLTTSLSRQLKQVKSMELDCGAFQCPDSVKNILANSLGLDMAYRTISTSAPSSEREGAEVVVKDGL